MAQYPIISISQISSPPDEAGLVAATITLVIPESAPEYVSGNTTVEAPVAGWVTVDKTV
jgi:hypothetical protein